MKWFKHNKQKKGCYPLEHCRFPSPYIFLNHSQTATSWCTKRWRRAIYLGNYPMTTGRRDTGQSWLHLWWTAEIRSGLADCYYIMLLFFVSYLYYHQVIWPSWKSMWEWLMTSVGEPKLWTYHSLVPQLFRASSDTSGLLTKSKPCWMKSPPSAISKENSWSSHH